MGAQSLKSILLNIYNEIHKKNKQKKSPFPK